jgi:hypothetical protein
MKFEIRNDVDMLLVGRHRLLLSEHHAYAKAGRKRFIKGKEAIAKRKEMARLLNKHSKNTNILDKGRITE